MSCFVYKVIRDLQSIDDVCINPIRRIGLIHKWSADSRVSSSGVYNLMFNLTVINKILGHCHSWRVGQYYWVGNISNGGVWYVWTCRFLYNTIVLFISLIIFSVIYLNMCYKIYVFLSNMHRSGFLLLIVFSNPKRYFFYHKKESLSYKRALKWYVALFFINSWLHSNTVYEIFSWWKSNRKSGRLTCNFKPIPLWIVSSTRRGSLTYHCFKAIHSWRITQD